MNAELIQQIAEEVREACAEICNKPASEIAKYCTDDLRVALLTKCAAEIRSLSLDDIVAKYAALSQEKV